MPDISEPRTGLHPELIAVTERIRARSQSTRKTYLDMLSTTRRNSPPRAKLSCGNIAHAAAACGAGAKERIAHVRSPNIGIVTSYNDMLSAHQPFEAYPAIIRAAAAALGGTAQVAGGVPAMCDGVTQGQPGMELSLFSRDVIALATAVSLSHNVFDSALMLGVCDKIVPGLVMGALAFGHLPVLFVPAGPMATGLANDEKTRVRKAYEAGELDRAALLAAEMKSYHGPGTCTFYGTANSNQMLMEFMGLHVPGSAFVHPDSSLRRAMTHEAVRIALQTHGAAGIGEILCEEAFVNGIVGLHATGGSTNHLIHLVAMAAASGIQLRWDDFADLARIVPLLARVYPNGPADVNQFHAAGGLAFVMRELLGARLLHADVQTVAGPGLARYATEPHLDGETLQWRAPSETSLDENILRPIARPFQATGGLALLKGNLGTAIVKTSAVNPDRRKLRAPVRVFDGAEGVKTAFRAGEFDRDVIVAVRFQGPAANGMPELHALMPILGLVQDRGHKVALISDGRLSGASGKVLSAIHLTPEAANGGPLARLQDGDVVEIDADAGTLLLDADAASFNRRAIAVADSAEHADMGRNLFARFRASVNSAELGAVSV